MGTSLSIFHLKQVRTLIALSLFLSVLINVFQVKAQVSDYAFSQNSIYTNDINYTSNIIQATMTNTIAARRELYINNGKSTAISSTGKGYPIGFKFWYDGQIVNSFGASANGYIKLGDSLQGITILNDTNFASFYATHPERQNIIAAFMRKVNKQALNPSSSSGIQYGVTGYPGERRLTISFLRRIVTQSSPFTYYDTQSFIRLYEFDNKIEILNRSDIAVPITKDTAVVGLLGSGGLIANNFSVRKVTEGINDWKTSVTGNVADGFCEFSSLLRPVHTSAFNPVPLAYNWRPSPLNKVPDCPIAYFKQLHPGNPNFVSVLEPSYFEAGYIMASNAIDVQLIQTIYWSPLYSSSPAQYDLYFGLDSLSLIPLAVNLSTNFYKLPVLSANTKYFYKVVTRNNNGESPSLIQSFTTGNDLNYCVSLNGRNATLQNFKLNTLNYSMTGNLDQTASYPASIYHTELKKDTTYKFNYTPVSGLPCFTIILFIDFNHNGILNDPGEKFIGNNASIMIPRTALLGPTKMRITQQSGCSPGNYDPCNAVNYQDFVVTIVPEFICKTFSIAPSFNGSTCYNTNDGSISLNPNGGLSPYNYTWVKDNTPVTLTATANNLSSGTYQCTLTDANNCVLVTTAMALKQPLPIHIDTITIAGNLEVNATGGTSPLQYEWFDGSNTYSENPPEGNYTLSISDANGCTAQMLNITIKKELPTIIANSVEFFKDIKLYPNPSTGIVTINVSNVKENLVVAILDLNGKTIRQQQIQNLETIIDLSGQNTGIYFFKVSTNSTSEVHKIFLE